VPAERPAVLEPIQRDLPELVLLANAGAAHGYRPSSETAA